MTEIKIKSSMSNFHYHKIIVLKFYFYYFINNQICLDGIFITLEVCHRITIVLIHTGNLLHENIIILSLAELIRDLQVAGNLFTSIGNYH